MQSRNLQKTSVVSQSSRLLAVLSNHTFPCLAERCAVSPCHCKPLSDFEDLWASNLQSGFYPRPPSRSPQ